MGAFQKSVRGLCPVHIQSNFTLKLLWRLRKQTPAPESKVPLAVREQSERCFNCRRRRSRTDKDSSATDKESNDGPRSRRRLRAASTFQGPAVVGRGAQLRIPQPVAAYDVAPASKKAFLRPGRQRCLSAAPAPLSSSHWPQGEIRVNRPCLSRRRP